MQSNLYNPDKDEMRRMGNRWALGFVGLGFCALVGHVILATGFSVAGERLTRTLRNMAFTAMVRAFAWSFYAYREILQRFVRRQYFVSYNKFTSCEVMTTLCFVLHARLFRSRQKVRHDIGWFDRDQSALGILTSRLETEASMVSELER